MNKNMNKPEQDLKSRRKLVGALAAGGSILSLKAAPDIWRKPIVASVMLPAHAQSSACIGTLNNCPAEDLFVYGPDTRTFQRSFDTNSLISSFPGVTLGGTTLTGSGRFSTQFNDWPNNAVDCGACGGESKYFSKYARFGNETVTYNRYGELRCGGEVVGAYAYFGSGTFLSGQPGTLTYTGSGTVTISYCKYLATL